MFWQVFQRESRHDPAEAFRAPKLLKRGEVGCYPPHPPLVLPQASLRVQCLSVSPPPNHIYYSLDSSKYLCMAAAASLLEYIQFQENFTFASNSLKVVPLRDFRNDERLTH